MKHTRWLIGMAMCAFLVGAGVAQNDWPVHRGNQQRTGLNDKADGPNLTQLTWWWPLRKYELPTVAVDNDNSDVPPLVSRTGTWVVPDPENQAIGFVGEDYEYAGCVAARSVDDPTDGADRTFRWTLRPLATQVAHYALYVQFPSSGTTLPGNTRVTPNALEAVYKVEWTQDGVSRSRVYRVSQTVGGYKIRIGGAAVFPASSTSPVYLTLYNTVPVEDNGFGEIVPIENPDNAIVVADAAYLANPPASAQSSPVVVHRGGIPHIYITRNIGSVDPSDPSGVDAQTQGELVCIVPPTPTVPEAVAKWVWSPSQQSNVNNVVDDTSSGFKKDSAWVQATETAGDFYGETSYETTVTTSANQSEWNNARWEPKLSASDNFDIYVWFPSSGETHLNTRNARYIVHYFDPDDGLTEDVIDNVNQEEGGKWVRIGSRSYPNDPERGQLWLEIVNYSPDTGDAGRYVQADAAMFVGGYQGSMVTTPTTANVRVKMRDGSTQNRDVVFVADQAGYIYMVDAIGDRGHTWAYWSYPSTPNTNDPNWEDPNKDADNGAPTIGGFLRTTATVARVGNKDILFIGSTNGRMYAIDCEGRGDYDERTATTGTTKRIWTYPDAVPDVDKSKEKNYASVVVGSPAYKDGVVYFGTTEGRIYALDAAGEGNGTTREKWIYPGRALDGQTEEDPIGAIVGTVSVITTGDGANLVVFGTAPYQLAPGDRYSGRVIALDADGSSNRRTTRRWVYPPLGDTTQVGNFSYGGPCYVPDIQVYQSVSARYDVVYIGAEDGRVYYINARNGELLYRSERGLGGAIRSAPTFAQVVPHEQLPPSRDSIIISTAAGDLIALNAREYGTLSPDRLGEAHWAGQLTEQAEFFGSVAIANGFMYALASNGRLYAFSDQAAPSDYDEGWEPFQETEPPDQSDDIDLKDTIVKRISRESYNQLRALTPGSTSPTPYDLNVVNETILEWGSTIYLVAYNFYIENEGGTVTFQLKGPSNTPRVSAPVKRYAENNPARKPCFAVYAYVVQGSRQAPFTPGEEYWVEATVRPPSGTAVGPFEMEPKPLLIANPLAVRVLNPKGGAANSEIGWTVNSTDNYVKINGSGGKENTVIANQGEINHGMRGSTLIEVADRSLLLYSTGRSLRQVMGTRLDLQFRGGAAAMYKPLPWDIPPVGFPNPSPDYPDIDRRQLGLWSDPLGTRNNLVNNAVGLPNPLGDETARSLVGLPIELETDVPMYQPANIRDGYLAKVYVWVDVDSDKRISGVSTSIVTDLPTAGAEAYRSLSTSLNIPPDEKLAIVEPTIDLGQLAHGVGWTPEPPRSNNNKYFHSSWVDQTSGPYNAFFKPFTVLSYSNVNMLNLRVASLLNQLPVSGPVSDPPLRPVGFFGDGLNPLAWLGADQALVSNLDPRFQSAVTLHKPRPGDRSPTSLRIPDAPYGTTDPNADPPMLGVAVPIGQPVGTYTQYIRVFEDLYNGRNLALDIDPVTNRAFETISEPAPRVKFTVRESRLTSDTEPGSLYQFDYPPTSTNPFRYANVASAAYRDRRTGEMVVAFSSQRESATDLNAPAGAVGNWSIYTGRLGVQQAQFHGTVPPPLLDLYAWRNAASDKWWQLGGGPYPGTSPDSLFTELPGTIVPNSAQYFEPTFPVNINDMPRPYLFWQGSVKKLFQGQEYTEYATFYSEISPSTGRLGTIHKVTGDTGGSAIDAAMPRYRPVVLGGGTGARIFWYGGTTGRYSLFVNETPSVDNPNSWSRPVRIGIPSSLASAKDPYPVAGPAGRIDLIYSGVMKDRNTNELFLATYGPEGPGGFINWERPRTRARINSEVAVLDTARGNVWRTQGIDWAIGGPGSGLDVAVNGRSILGEGERDSSNERIRYRSLLGGYVVVDPAAGTITFPSIAPGPQDIVTVSYTPRVMRLTPSNLGGHTEPVQFVDSRPIGNLAYTFRSTGTAAQANDYVPVDRRWVLYKRGSTAPGQPMTPYYQTYRVGVNLPTPAAVGTTVSVGGNTSFYTVDYTRGKVYFTLADAGRSVNIAYVAAGGGSHQVSATVDWIAESEETTVPIERSIAESQLCAFADPSTERGRPDFIWLFWSSTRNGASDVYFQTISPRFDIVPAGR
ncbi:MAG: PQQ-binding-like beta-propeller repeat protein [Fimbriimonadia bacterium]